MSDIDLTGTEEIEADAELEQPIRRHRAVLMNWRFISYVVGSLIAVLLGATLMNDRIVSYEGPWSALLFGVILGALMAFVKPVLQLVAIPITCLTFGLVALVINAALFGIAAALTPGVEASMLGGLIGALTVSIFGGLIFTIVDEEDELEVRQ